MNNSTLSKKVFHTINKNYLFENKPTIAVGVSGGPDSIALVFILRKWIKNKKGNLIALIVDHQLRKNSYLEAKEVRSFLNYNTYNNDDDQYEGSLEIEEDLDEKFVKNKSINQPNSILSDWDDETYSAW